MDVENLTETHATASGALGRDENAATARVSHSWVHEVWVSPTKIWQRVQTVLLMSDCAQHKLLVTSPVPSHYSRYTEISVAT